MALNHNPPKERKEDLNGGRVSPPGSLNANLTGQAKFSSVETSTQLLRELMVRWYREVERLRTQHEMQLGGLLSLQIVGFSQDITEAALRSELNEYFESEDSHIHSITIGKTRTADLLSHSIPCCTIQVNTTDAKIAEARRKFDPAKLYVMPVVERSRLIRWVDNWRLEKWQQIEHAKHFFPQHHGDIEMVDLKHFMQSYFQHLCNLKRLIHSHLIDMDKMFDSNSFDPLSNERAFFIQGKEQLKKLDHLIDDFWITVLQCHTMACPEGGRAHQQINAYLASPYAHNVTIDAHVIHAMIMDSIDKMSSSAGPRLKPSTFEFDFNRVLTSFASKYIPQIVLPLILLLINAKDDYTNADQISNNVVVIGIGLLVLFVVNVRTSAEVLNRNQQLWGLLLDDFYYTQAKLLNCSVKGHILTTVHKTEEGPVGPFFRKREKSL